MRKGKLFKACVTMAAVAATGIAGCAAFGLKDQLTRDDDDLFDEDEGEDDEAE